MTYTYGSKSTSPDLKGIHTAVGAGSMTDKTIDYCRWDKGADGPSGAETLIVVFDNELSGPDKTLLDTDVTNNS